jgi:hypothetical protein
MERNREGIDLFTSVILDFGSGRQATSSQSIEIVCARVHHAAAGLCPLAVRAQPDRDRHLDRPREIGAGAKGDSKSFTRGQAETGDTD